MTVCFINFIICGTAAGTHHVILMQSTVSQQLTYSSVSFIFHSSQWTQIHNLVKCIVNSTVSQNTDTAVGFGNGIGLAQIPRSFSQCTSPPPKSQRNSWLRAINCTKSNHQYVTLLFQISVIALIMKQGMLKGKWNQKVRFCTFWTCKIMTKIGEIADRS